MTKDLPLTSRTLILNPAPNLAPSPFPNHILHLTPLLRLLPKANARRFRRPVRTMQHEHAVGLASFAEIYQQLMSWVGHAKQADTHQLRRRLFREHPFRRATTG
jgi:hypothetical protein